MRGVRRRQFLLSIVALLAVPLTQAQQSTKVWRVGFLGANRRPNPIDSAPLIRSFLQGMRELGYVEGKNLAIEWRFADSEYERLPGLAAELVRLKVDVIVTGGTPAISALQKATTTIPIVFASAGDPVASGFVASLARPGGNITGRANLLSDLGPKQLELLLTTMPKLTRLAVLVNPANSAGVAALKNIESAARSVGVAVLPVEARTEQEIEKAFPTMNRENAKAVIVLDDGVFSSRPRQIAELSVKNRLPSMFAFRLYVVAGGLMSYGPSLPEEFRRTATLVDKIFRGAKPAELPVEQPTDFKFLINLKTATALGLKVPQSLLARADEVIR